jgi:hypothetical protein
MDVRSDGTTTMRAARIASAVVNPTPVRAPMRVELLIVSLCSIFSLD